MSTICQSVCWMEEWAYDATCSLEDKHAGKHMDNYEGWEWL